ncbi:hypothetical protein PXD56_01415 [Maribacter sp. SA7]|uniref:hypothetical protein n=1 Tax=Maribacter zhoushanensis TaxID=3030012 RepID=UPI0023ED57C9|nr:hypothetical protein [Maribacter zhoushanensis]MDF4201593.1 hypothetical protein [Maribacter zhoushanensis]
MIFDIFKKKRTNDQSVAARLTDIMNQRPNNLHMVIYIKDQILFQVMPAKNFKDKGLNAQNPNDFVAIHFFNKNKTLTFDKLEKLKSLDLEKDYFRYEDPQGNFNYLKIIGQNPIEIEKEIYANFKDIYELDDFKEITINYADY